MIRPRVHPVLAGQHYRSLELASRTSRSSQHVLVGSLYEQLLKSLDAIIEVAVKDRVLSGNSHVTRARSILIALERSLDFERGGMLAPLMARVYQTAAKELMAGIDHGDCEKLRELRCAISTITYAWASLSAV